METNYDVDYFIRKFEKIADHLIGANDISCCALGHCGGWASDSEESKALSLVLIKYHEYHNTAQGKDYEEIVYFINDGLESFSKLGDTPKQRILAALYDIKKMQQLVYADITKSLAVLPVDKIETDVILKNVKI